MENDERLYTWSVDVWTDRCAGVEEPAADERSNRVHVVAVAAATCWWIVHLCSTGA